MSIKYVWSNYFTLVNNSITKKPAAVAIDIITPAY
jgi:hypothetical protein